MQSFRAHIQLIALGALFHGACSRHYHAEKQDFAHYSMRDRANSSRMDTLIARYKTRVDAETRRVIAKADAALTRNAAQSPLGNFVCDAMLHAADSLFPGSPPDLVIINRGGLRIDLPAGDIRVSAIFELMPFDNDLVLLTVSGRKLKDFIPLFEEKKHSYSGAALTMKNGKVSTFLLKGQPIDDERHYTVFVSDFLAGGGDNFSFLLKPISSRSINLKLRDAIISYCLFLTRNGNTIKPYTDARLTFSK